MGQCLPPSLTWGREQADVDHSGCLPHWGYPKAGRANMFPSAQLQPVTSGVPECHTEKIHVAQLCLARNRTTVARGVLG